ncbi:helix-turn-helix transcriptional regulator [Lysinibacillus tabacifolii]|uniref:YafY family transcriptional regulator n=1 Tax=Lysinibacillus tabacifolii TaxID=1173107 RepID=A0ABY2SS77_9BACI|nr:YafY family protein [Lysinibacillus tabacifolii]TKI44388.1 YafY family transcriptional regulator [Lysinibacillus tabacifolii]
MKVDRLLTMTMILINRKKVKAQELAELFDVSVRTIYRDVETLSCAGVPILSQQGVNGGISLMEGYRMDKQVLTKEELTSLSIALKSALTSYEDAHAKAVLEKLTGVADEQVKQSIDHFFIDLSPWGQNILLKEQITLLKNAIERERCVSFLYSTTYGTMTNRIIEPHTLVQKGKMWYIYGYCTLRNGFRLFKISRMKQMKEEQRSFERKEVHLSDLPWDKAWQQPENLVELTLSFDAQILTLIEETFGVEQIDYERSIVHVALPEDEWLYGFLLSFGNRIKLLDPPYLVDIVQKRAQEIVEIYTANNR